MIQEISKTEYLTSEEEDRLNTHEQGIENFGNLALENARKAGELLDTVNQEGLWKKKRNNSDFPAFSDFGEYAKARFGRGKTMSYNYIHISKITKALEEEGFDVNELGSIQNAMQVYFELKKLGYYKRGKLHPLFREVLHKGMLVAENISIIEETGEMKMTPESITAAFNTVQEIVINQAYEIDGVQIPIRLGQLATDDQASQMMYENIQRRRLASGEDIKKKQKQRFQPRKPEVIDFNGKGEKKEEVTLNCPKHLSTQGAFLTKAGLGMGCGCYAILEVTEKGSKLVWYEEEQL